jgi:hypothetical protein
MSTSPQTKLNRILWTWLVGCMILVIGASLLAYYFAKDDIQKYLVGVRTLGHLLGIIFAATTTLLGLSVYFYNAFGGKREDPPTSLRIESEKFKLSNTTTGITLVLAGALFFWIILSKAQVQTDATETRKATSEPASSTTELQKKASTRVGEEALADFLSNLRNSRELPSYDEWQKIIVPSYNKAKTSIDEALKTPKPDDPDLQALLRDIKGLADANWSVPKWLGERAKKVP